jgi:NAD(P)-dependent dehydrogenase (short-subunit alcohol dehydrogenase family)
MRLKDKVIVITGAASGIGRAAALRFAQEGASVILGDRHVQRLGEVVAEIRAAGSGVESAVGDISEQSVAEALVDLAIATHGRIDVLVNNAGIMDYFHGVEKVTNEVWRRVLGTNLEGPMFTCRRALPFMLEQGKGAIVNIASNSGLSGGSAGAAYTASKHALIGLTRNTAVIYAKQGIRCNAICPGGVNTNIAESMLLEQCDPVGLARATEINSNAAGLLEPADIAALALYLSSDEARYINGAVISADAGLSAR